MRPLLPAWDGGGPVPDLPHMQQLPEYRSDDRHQTQPTHPLLSRPSRGRAPLRGQCTSLSPAGMLRMFAWSTGTSQSFCREATGA